MQITNIHKFFTLYVILLLVFHKHTAKYVDLLLLSVIVFVIGCYLSFVEPKKYVFYIFNKELEISNGLRLALVDTTHLAMLIFALVITQRLEVYQVLMSLLILIMYTSLVDMRKVYLVSPVKLMVLGMLTCIAYLCIICWQEKLV